MRVDIILNKHLKTLKLCLFNVDLIAGLLRTIHTRENPIRGISIFELWHKPRHFGRSKHFAKQ